MESQARAIMTILFIKICITLLLHVATVEPEENEQLVLKGSRPTTPSKQSLDRRVFESEQSTETELADHVKVERWPSRKSIDIKEVTPLATQATKDIRAKQQSLMEKAMDALKKSKSPPDSILSSAVGFYAAHATLLAAAVIGTCHV